MPRNETSCLTHDRLKKPYARVLIPAEDGTYAAELLEFPGCYSQGDTPGEAIQNLDEAAASWIEAALEQGQDIPEPFANRGYSGKINLRLPRSIHKKAARFAQKEDVSLNQFFASAIAARVGAEEFLDRLIEKFESRLRPLPLVVCVSASVSQFFSVSPGPCPISPDVHEESGKELAPRLWQIASPFALTADSGRIVSNA